MQVEISMIITTNISNNVVLGIFRNNIDFIEWMKLDFKYVNNIIFLLDLKIIFQIFFVLFGDRNAC